MTIRTETIAFIGLGKMGAAVARRIQDAGFRLVVYNRSPEKAERFAARGATVASSPCKAAAQADIVITSLMDDRSVLDAAEGPDGIVAGLKRGGVHIGITTISPSASVRLAELHRAQGSDYVAAPVLGRPDAAEKGTLRTFVAGRSDSIERCMPVFEAYTAVQIVLGEDVALAASMKLVANFLLVSAIELFGEAFAFGEKRGLETAHINAVIDGLFPHPALQDYSRRIGAREFLPAGFTMQAGLKDVQLMIDAAKEKGATLPYAGLIRERMLSEMKHEGDAPRDWAALTDASRREAGLL